MKRDDDQRPSDEPKKLTGAELKRMIEKVLEDYQLLTPLPLDAEPPEDDRTQDPPEDTKQVLEQKVISYKGKRDEVNHAVEAIKHLRQCTDEQLAAVYKHQGVQTYEQFLQAVARYERAKKPK